MVTMASNEKTEKAANRLDELMTPAQIARRKFKSSLPRKTQERRLSAMEALGEVFTLLDRFRTILAEQNGPDPNQTIYAALAFYLPETDPAMLADTLTVPEPGKIGPFCDKVMALDRPRFLGLVFVQMDPNTDKRAYRAVSFAVPFMTGPEADGRLQTAQQMELAKLSAVQKALKGARG